MAKAAAKTSLHQSLANLLAEHPAPFSVRPVSTWQLKKGVKPDVAIFDRRGRELLGFDDFELARAFVQALNIAAGEIDRRQNWEQE